MRYLLVLLSLTFLISCNSEGTSSEAENRINCGNYDLYEDVSEVLNYSFIGETTCLSGDCFDPAEILLNFGYLDMRNSVPDNHTGYYSLNSVFTMPNNDAFGISYGIIGYDDTISEMKIRLIADNTLCQAQYGVDAYNDPFSHMVLFNDNIPTFNNNCEEIIKGDYDEVQLCEGYVEGVDDFIIYLSGGTFSLKRIDHINP